MKRGNAKRIFTILCTLLLLTAVPVSATEDNELVDIKSIIVQPRFSNISVFMNSFDITDSGKAIVESALSARDCDEVRISMYLQRYENDAWTTVKHWAETRSGVSMLLSKEWYVDRDYQYRMKSYGYVYSDGTCVEYTTHISDTQLY